MDEHYFPGRPKSSTRSVTDECLVFSIRALKKNGVLGKGLNQQWNTEWKNRDEKVTSRMSFQVVAGSLSDLALILDYEVLDPSNGAKIPTSYRVELVTSPCRFGGRRYWFLCPLSRDDKACLRRVGCLFLPPGGRYFGCRTCYNLTYRCQKEHDKKVDALMKLGPLGLIREMDAGDLRHSLMVTTAAFRMLEKLDKKK